MYKRNLMRALWSNNLPWDNPRDHILVLTRELVENLSPAYHPHLILVGMDAINELEFVIPDSAELYFILCLQGARPRTNKDMLV
jgi:hypothetical protein